MQTPILFLIFNRPEMSSRVFQRIREARPEKLFIAADGPRDNVQGEAQRCMETRKSILAQVDWPCEVETLLRDKNLGCKMAVSSAITWFFEQVEEGIILEDDCLPDPSFFPFCEEMLDRYRDDEKIMMISGDNFQPKHRGAASYFFSRFVHIWGWATWRRAWNHYDLSMQKWPAYRDSKKIYAFLPRPIARKREQQFNRAYSGNVTTWDTQWVFACWEAEGLSVLPNSNLVTNIDSSGTHMKIYDPCTNRSITPMHFPLIHPPQVAPHERADAYTGSNVVLRGWPQTLRLIIRHLLSVLMKDPRQLPSDIKTIIGSLMVENRERKK